jgi:hypothetical protein
MREWLFDYLDGVSRETNWSEDTYHRKKQTKHGLGKK